MKNTPSATISLHQNHGPCYLHLPIFLLNPGEFLVKAFVSTVLVSNLDRRTLFNYIYYETILM